MLAKRPLRHGLVVLGTDGEHDAARAIFKHGSLHREVRLALSGPLPKRDAFQAVVADDAAP